MKGGATSWRVPGSWWGVVALGALLGACTGPTDISCPDRDEDGFDCRSDCAPEDATTFPGAEEVPGDGIDQDCDEVDACFLDVDDDEHGTREVVPGTEAGCTAQPRMAAAADDCDDADAGTFPGARDVANDGVDQDCSGGDLVDDPCPDDAVDDSDGDGVCESDDVCPGHDDTRDADGDDVPDGCDACDGDDAAGDEDADGVCDDEDLCPFDAPEDDDDGDGVCDTDDLCVGDDADGDPDGDGVCSDQDDCPQDAPPEDDDGDGVCDADDACAGDDATGDGDADGVCDDVDPCPQDVPDDDDDDDGVCDADDACAGDDATGDGDADGVCDDVDPCPQDVPDDDDDDGVCDADDVCDGDDASGDTDRDGVCDDADACPFDAPDDDADDDGVCDADDLCDGDDATGDDDRDGLCGDVDPCPEDAPDDDDDGDGVCDADDVCDGDDAAGDTDGDAVCDDLDPCPEDAPQDDDDGDGVCDADDACTGDDATGDDDADGVCDSDDVCFGRDAAGDTDDDGLCDDEDPCAGPDNELGDPDEDGACGQPGLEITSVATLSTLPNQAGCWYTGMSKSVFTDSTGLTWVAAGEHRACDLGEDRIVVHHRDAGSADWLPDEIYGITYQVPRAPHDLGVVSSISMARAANEAPRVVANVREGASGWAPDTTQYFRRVGGSWQLTPDVLSSATLQSDDHNGFTFTTVAAPGSDEVHLIGSDIAWNTTSFHAVASSTSSGGTTWGAITAVDTQPGAVDRSAIWYESADLRFGVGRQTWIDKPACAVKSRAWTGTAWSGTLTSQPLGYDGCSGSSSDYYGYFQAHTDTLVLSPDRTVVLFFGEADLDGSDPDVTMVAYDVTGSTWTRRIVPLPSWSLHLSDGGGGADATAFTDADGLVRVLHLNRDDTELRVYDLATGEDRLLYRSSGHLTFVDAERHDPQVVVWGEVDGDGHHLRVASLALDDGVATGRVRAGAAALYVGTTEVPIVDSEVSCAALDVARGGEVALAIAVDARDEPVALRLLGDGVPGCDVDVDDTSRALVLAVISGLMWTPEEIAQISPTLGPAVVAELSDALRVWPTLTEAAEPTGGGPAVLAALERLLVPGGASPRRTVGALSHLDVMLYTVRPNQDTSLKVRATLTGNWPAIPYEFVRVSVLGQYDKYVHPSMMATFLPHLLYADTRGSSKAVDIVVPVSALQGRDLSRMHVGAYAPSFAAVSSDAYFSDGKRWRMMEVEFASLLQTSVEALLSFEFASCGAFSNECCEDLFSAITATSVTFMDGMGPQNDPVVKVLADSVEEFARQSVLSGYGASCGLGSLGSRFRKVVGVVVKFVADLGPVLETAQIATGAVAIVTGPAYATTELNVCTSAGCAGACSVVSGKVSCTPPIQCTSGACCDGAGQYRPTSYTCQTSTEYRCAGTACSANVESRVVSRACSGASSSCSGTTTYGSWTTSDNCSSSEVCDGGDLACVFDAGCDCNGVPGSGSACLAPWVNVTPRRAPQGTLFQEPGGGFTPNGKVTLYFLSPTGSQTNGPKQTANASGAYSYSYQSDLLTGPGRWQYWAMDDSTGIVTSRIPFDITAPHVSVSPSSGSTGTTFQEPGTGFTPNRTVTLYFRDPAGTVWPTTKTADSSGNYTHSYLVNAGTLRGTWRYWAVDDTTGTRSDNEVQFAVY